MWSSQPPTPMPHGSQIAQDQYRGTLRAEGERRPTATRVAERSLGDSLPPDSEQEDDGSRPVTRLARTGRVQRATADAGTNRTSAVAGHVCLVAARVRSGSS